MATANTGTSDTTYNLTSVLYHALQGVETYDRYIRDAEQAQDNDLAQFFRECSRPRSSGHSGRSSCWHSG